MSQIWNQISDNIDDISTFFPHLATFHDSLSLSNYQK
jgi:hypothetical protein